MKWLLKFLLIFLLSTNVIAKKITKNDVELTKQIITQQIEAFKRKDALEAYYFASPLIKKNFENPKVFMEMVKNYYEPVSNPKNYYFMSYKLISDIIYHQVQITSQSNKSFIATYSLIYIDKEWKISGCTISKMDQKLV